MLFAFIVFKTIRGGAKATDEVWDGAKPRGGGGGQGLEWTLSSPPLHHSFPSPCRWFGGSADQGHDKRILYNPLPIPYLFLRTPDLPPDGVAARETERSVPVHLGHLGGQEHEYQRNGHRSFIFHGRRCPQRASLHPRRPASEPAGARVRPVTIRKRTDKQHPAELAASRFAVLTRRFRDVDVATAEGIS